MREHDHEPIRGLPEALPAGERILWQGAPEWRALSRRALHVLKVAVYMTVLLAWNAVATVRGGATAWEAVVATLWLLPLPLVAVGLLTLLGWAYARTTVYTLTDERLVVRSGVALPVTINLPHRLVEAAGVRVHGGGVGDVSVRLQPDQRAAYFALWPSVRPWHLTHPEPMLRCIPDAQEVARILGKALQDHVAARARAASQTAQLGSSHQSTGDTIRQPLVAAGR